MRKRSLGDHTLQRNRPRRKIIGVRDQALLSVSSVCSDCLHGFDSVIIDLCLLVSHQPWFQSAVQMIIPKYLTAPSLPKGYVCVEKKKKTESGVKYSLTLL